PLAFVFPQRRCGGGLDTLQHQPRQFVSKRFVIAKAPGSVSRGPMRMFLWQRIEVTLPELGNRRFAHDGYLFRARRTVPIRLRLQIIHVLPAFDCPADDAAIFDLPPGLLETAWAANRTVQDAEDRAFRNLAQNRFAFDAVADTVWPAANRYSRLRKPGQSRGWRPGADTRRIVPGGRFKPVHCATTFRCPTDCAVIFHLIPRKLLHAGAANGAEQNIEHRTTGHGRQHRAAFRRQANAAAASRRDSPLNLPHQPRSWRPGALASLGNRFEPVGTALALGCPADDTRPAH